jgi:hypothetical protein
MPLTPQQDQEDNHTRAHYATWWYETQVAITEWRDYIDQEVARGRWDGDDLGDFVDGIATLMSFGPNPRAFDPPIMPRDVGYPDLT